MIVPPSHGPREDWMRNPRKVLAKGSAHKSSALIKLKLGPRAYVAAVLYFKAHVF